MKNKEIQEFILFYAVLIDECQLRESSLPLKEMKTETWTVNKWKDEHR